MGIKPLVVAARYKYILLIPFAILIPVAALVSYSKIETEYTSTARLFARESVIADSFSSGNPYTSPAENRAGDVNELLRTEKFKLAIAEFAGLPTATRSQQEFSMWEIEFGTAVYASGRHLLVVSHTSADPERAQKIVNAIVETFRSQYRDQVLANAGNALKIYEANLEENSATLEAAENDLNAYLATRPANEPLANDPRYTSLQRDVDRAQQDYGNTQDAILDIRTQRENSISGQDFTLAEQDAANVPANPDAFSRRDFVAYPVAGFLVALSISAAAYAFLLRTDSRLRTREDVEQVTTVPVLGTIQDVGSEKKRHWPKDFARLAAGAQGTVESH
jgi:capsular polysaccharide biosynthesis protein